MSEKDEFRVFGKKEKYWGKQKKRPLLWNFRAKRQGDEDKMVYYFFFANVDPITIEDLTSQLYKLIAPSEPVTRDGKLQSGPNRKDILYRLIVAEKFNVGGSYHSKPDEDGIKKIYNGEVIRDPEFYDRRLGLEVLECYAVNRIKKLLKGRRKPREEPF